MNLLVPLVITALEAHHFHCFVPQADTRITLDSQTVLSAQRAISVTAQNPLSSLVQTQPALQDITVQLVHQQALVILALKVHTVILLDLQCLLSALNVMLVSTVTLLD